MDFHNAFDSSPACIGIGIATLLLTIIFYIVKDKNLPPGPTGLPIVGYLPFLRRDFPSQLQEMAKKYGDVYSFRVTGQLYIHLNSIKAIREAHVGKTDCLTGRCSSYNTFKHGFDEGLAFASGEVWLNLRKFFVLHLRKYGITSFTENMKSLMYDNLSNTIKEIEEKKGEPFEIIDLLSDKCASIMQQLVFCDFDVSHEDLQQLNEGFVSVLNALSGFNLLLAGPLAKYVILPFTSGRREFVEGLKTTHTILRKIVKEHKDTFDENQPRNIIDHYIIERNIRLRRKDPTARYFTDNALVSTLLQLVGDGNLSVAYFIVVYLQALFKRPEIQEKMFKEITEVIGLDRQPTLEDKSRMPYTNAVCNEILRTTDMFPVSPSLEFTTATTFRGYHIPKGSVTLLNVYGAQHDPEVYEDPYTFNPSRYIATPEKPKAELPIMFGVGKRQCVGDAFATTQAFLYMVTIVKNFRISAPENDSSNTPLVAEAQSMKLCAHPRN